MLRHAVICLIVSAISLVIAAQTQAAFIVQPVDATASSFFSPREEARAISGVGLSDASIVETNDPVPLVYPTHDNDGGNTNWLSNTGDNTPDIVFDLGSSFFLEGLHLWNHNASSLAGRERGIRDVTVSFSTTSAVAGFGSSITYSVGNGNEFAISPGGADLGESKSFGGQIEAQWVRFDITANYGDPDLTGISEVRFVADQQFVAPVPEPNSLLLVGSLLLGCAVRRRKNLRYIKA